MRSFDLQRGHAPKVENHCVKVTQFLMTAQDSTRGDIMRTPSGISFKFPLSPFPSAHPYSQVSRLLSPLVNSKQNSAFEDSARDIHVVHSVLCLSEDFSAGYACLLQLSPVKFNLLGNCVSV